MQAMARAAASPSVFASARAEGRAMSLDDALDYALAAPALPTLAPPSGEAPLSAREREVVELIARGLSNREIAERLVIAPRTAEAHVSHILVKLGLRSRAQVAIWAMEHGLLDPAKHT
jgi:non-specific serine/threonine protein kinase